MKRSKKQAAGVANPGLVVAADLDLNRPLLHAQRSREYKSKRTCTLAGVAKTMLEDTQRRYMALWVLEQRRLGGKPPSTSPPGQVQFDVDALTSVLLDRLRQRVDILR